jgi:hypothetical protein
MSKWRRTSWQQLIIAQTNFLEYERMRLCPNDRQNGVSGQRSSACHAGDAAKRHLDDARQAAGIPTRQPPAARLANVWSGALVCSAFANLHTAKVVLVDLYAEEDIQAAAPGVLARLVRGKSLRMPSSLVSRSIWLRVLSTSGPMTW